MNNHCVVLTCTVKPKAEVAVTRRDPEIRLNDYVEAIIKWHGLSTKLNFRILVIENSNSLERVKERLPKNIRDSVVFHQSSPDVNSGKEGISAGEFLMLKDSISVIEAMKGIDFCWKVTGRLFVTNFRKISKSQNSQMKVNRFYSPRHIIDTRFFGISFPLYSRVFSQEINFTTRKEPQSSLSLETQTFSTMEDFLTRVCHELEANGNWVQSLNQIPAFEGFSASTGKKLDNFNAKVRIKIANSIRGIAIKLIAGSVP